MHAVLNGGAQGSQLSSQPSQASDAEQPPAKRQKSTPSAGLLVSTASADKESLPASSAPAPIQETGDSTRYQATMPSIMSCLLDPHVPVYTFTADDYVPALHVPDLTGTGCILGTDLGCIDADSSSPAVSRQCR